jgi:hypothetical protein
VISFQDQLDKDKKQLKAIHSSNPLQFDPSLDRFVAYMRQELDRTKYSRQTETMIMYRGKLTDLETYVDELRGRTAHGKVRPKKWWRFWS